MKPFLPLLAVSALLLSACVSQTPDYPTPDYQTPTPTRTPTPTLTSTPTITPTPALPPEALTRLAGRDWRIEGDKVMVGDVAWYTQDAEGRWQPAQFVADFDSFQFSLEGLEIANEDGVVRIYDPNASDEAARLVYEDGKVNILFAVEQAKKICSPTPFKPVRYTSLKNGYWSAPEQEKAFLKYLARMNVMSGKPFVGGFPILIDMQKQCWGRVLDNYNFFIFEAGDDDGRKVFAIPLMRDWHFQWFGIKNPFDNDPDW